MKIEVFDAIKKGINLSLKSKTILGLIALNWGFIIILVFLGDKIINEKLASLISLFIGIFISLAIVKVAYENLMGRKISIPQALIAVAKKLPYIILAMILYFVIIGLGMIALIIPGIYLAVKYYFYSYNILLGNQGIKGSFKKSGEIIKGNMLKLFSLIVLLIFVILASTHLINIAEIESLIINLIFSFILFLMNGISAVIFTVFYFQLIKKEENTKKGVVEAEITPIN